MDPYLEGHWRDVHHRLITYASDALQDALPPDLRARVEERVVLEGSGDADALYPDVRVIEGRPQRGGGMTAVITKPGNGALILDATEHRLTEGYIEIIDAGSGNRVITVIEVLSPTNKTRGEGLEEYARKQREILQSNTNLVEIDLLRMGTFVVAVPLRQVEKKGRTPYIVCVRRAAVPNKAEVHLVGLGDPLPKVKIPLRPKDQDVVLDLQSLIELCYRKGRYEGDIDYAREPYPPLRGEAAAWVDELLRNKGLRPTAPAKRKRRRRKPAE
jgi:hypothetical protein